MTSSKQEWRTIPEFPLYEITSDGDVRNKETWTVLKELQNSRTEAYFYTLHKTGETKRYSRSYERLMYQAWPELLAGWKPVENYPGYLINDKGEVMQTRWYRILESKAGAVRLRKDGKRITFYPCDYLDERKDHA